MEEVRQSLGVPLVAHPADVQVFKITAVVTLPHGERLLLEEAHLDVAQILVQSRVRVARVGRIMMGV